MTYHTFIGIDIGKDTFHVSVTGSQNVAVYPNTLEGRTQFLQDQKASLPQALCILETTGGYERALLNTLCQHQVAVHRANTRQVKNFIRSYGAEVKTDRLDAQALARYGQERHPWLSLFKPLREQAVLLCELVQRRHDLKKMRVAEKNRCQAPSASPRIQRSCQEMIEALTRQIDEVSQEIQDLFSRDPVLRAKQEILQDIPGIGEVTSCELLVLLPELGELTRRQIASLAGLAPRAKESGRYIAK